MSSASATRMICIKNYIINNPVNGERRTVVE